MATAKSILLKQEKFKAFCGDGLMFLKNNKVVDVHVLEKTVIQEGDNILIFPIIAGG